VRTFLYFAGILLYSLTLLPACRKKNAEKNSKVFIDSSKGTYFSIRQFTADQMKTYHGYPFSFIKTTTINGTTDSSIENMNTMDWGFIFKTFFAADIGEYRFLGKYRFTLFEDDATATRNFLYEAKDDSLYTQKLQISADQLNNKIRSIYIETAKHAGFTDEEGKLYYNPEKKIQIQHYEKSSMGKAQSSVIEYRFM
jgi:hypothetical protein